MYDYRLYALDHRGRITRAMEIRAPNDEAAIARALEADNNHGLELWQGGRRVMIFPPEGRLS